MLLAGAIIIPSLWLRKLRHREVNLSNVTCLRNGDLQTLGGNKIVKWLQWPYQKDGPFYSGNYGK